jgi:hypothetical protein
MHEDCLLLGSLLFIGKRKIWKGNPLSLKRLSGKKAGTGIKKGQDHHQFLVSGLGPAPAGPAPFYHFRQPHDQGHSPGFCHALVFLTIPASKKKRKIHFLF